ncbi:MAG: MerR family transcriptional regulator [Ferruginibacter sp.]
MDFFTIKDLENLSGIKAHTLRIWEQRYGFIKPERTQTNIRYYNNDELKKILNISLLNKNGYKISHISAMSGAEISEAVLSLKDIPSKEQKLANVLLQKLIDLEISGFEKLLNASLLEAGVDRTMESVVFPLLSKIGTLWLTSHIRPAQEHIVSNMIRQKILAATDQLPPAKAAAGTVLLFLPEGERHELGLLYMYYKLKKSHFNTIYLGADVPLADVKELVSKKKPAYIYIHLTGTAPYIDLHSFLKALSAVAKNALCVVTGDAVAAHSKKLPKNMVLQLSPAEVPAFLMQYGK